MAVKDTEIYFFELYLNIVSKIKILRPLSQAIVSNILTPSFSLCSYHKGERAKPENYKLRSFSLPAIKFLSIFQ
jgi:hypothetical protein